jgi:hypothetical protein
MSKPTGVVGQVGRRRGRPKSSENEIASPARPQAPPAGPPPTIARLRLLRA